MLAPSATAVIGLLVPLFAMPSSRITRSCRGGYIVGPPMNTMLCTLASSTPALATVSLVTSMQVESRSLMSASSWARETGTSR